MQKFIFLVLQNQWNNFSASTEQEPNAGNLRHAHHGMSESILKASADKVSSFCEEN